MKIRNLDRWNKDKRIPYTVEEYKAALKIVSEFQFAYTNIVPSKYDIGIEGIRRHLNNRLNIDKLCSDNKINGESIFYESVISARENLFFELKEKHKNKLK